MSDYKKLSFNKLTPTDGCYKKEYFEAFDFAIKENDIKNIAVTGVYGSGKSSLIKTYIKNKEEKFITISLATFKPNKSENENSSENIENLLEARIINQLLYQIKPDNVPLTNFKIKGEHKNLRGKAFKYALFLMLLFISCFLIFKNGDIVEFIGYKNTNELNCVGLFISSFGFKIVSILAFIVSFFLIIKRFLETLVKHSTSFKKMGFQGFDIEIIEDSKISYFDKYISEVVYLFQNADTNVFIFEDIDRYGSIQIFERLREINYLVNGNNKKVIKFIYMIKDDILKSEDRTKFFDFIIPIIPVVTGSNSYEIIVKKLEQFKLLINETKFLKIVSTYIEDMRLLNNILNEFKVYGSILCRDKNNKNEDDKVALEAEKLFAIIVYKNIFPFDFAKLHFQKSYINNVFDNKEELKRLHLNKLEEELNKIETDIKQIDNEHLKSIDELNAIYFFYDEKIELDRGSASNRAELIQKIREGYDANITGYRRYDIKDLIQEEENRLSENEEYSERKALIEKKSEEEIEKLEQRKSEINDKIQEFSHYSILDILKNIPEDVFFMTGSPEHYDIVKHKYFSLLKHFIREGYIGRDYHNYITYFYPHSLNFIDKYFFDNVIARGVKRFYDEKINCKELMERLGENDFSHSSILNVYLIKYLLKNSDKNNYSKYLDEIIILLEVKKEWSFLDNLLKSIISDSHKETLLKSSKFKDIIDKSGYSFLFLSEIISAKDLIEFVIDEERYDFNRQNMELILNIRYGINSDFGSEANAIQILRKKGENFRFKEKYITLFISKTINIYPIEDTKIQNILLKKGLVCPNIKNLLVYFENNNNELDENMIKFINKFEQKPDFKEVSEQLQEDLFLEITKSNEIDDDVYELFISDIRGHYDSFSINDLQKDKLDILIKHNKVPMNEANLDFIRENYKENVLSFILKNVEDYIELEDINDVEFKDILISGKTSDEVKKKIIDSFGNLKIPTLVVVFDKQTKVICDYIIKHIIGYVSSYGIDGVVLSKEILLNVIKSKKIQKKQKYQLFLNSFDNLSREEVFEILSQLQRKDIIRVLKSNKFKYTQANLIQVFRNKGYID